MGVASKTVNTMTAIGASCVAPSVHTLNAVSGATTLMVGFVAASALYIATGPIRRKLGAPLKPATDKIANTWVGRNFFKAAALSTAAIIGGPAAINTYDDVQNGDDFSVSFSNNVLSPAYELGRYGVHEGLVPLGRLTTRTVNGAIETAFDINTPNVASDPIFNAQSSWRGRCLEPGLKLVLDGGVFFLDNKIRGEEVPRRGPARELRDSLTQRDVHYTARPIC